jgi:septum site-determining protein MinD
VDETILIVTSDEISLRSAERAAQVMDAKNSPRPLLVVNRLDPQLVRAGEMMSARTISQVLDLHLIGVIPEDPVVYRSLLRHDLLIHFDCEARNAVLRLAARLQGRSVPFPPCFSDRQSLWRRLFSRTIKEVTPIDDH